MEMVFHEEEYEISMANGKPDDTSPNDVGVQSCSCEDSKVTAAVPGTAKRSFCRYTAVCLGLLCLLFLIGLITLWFQSTRSISEREMEIALLHKSYNNLTRERAQIEASYNNLISERHQLENNLTRQREQLQTSNNNLTSERHQLENNLTRQRAQLQASYNQLATEKDQLEEDFEALTKERNDLQRKLQDGEACWKILTEDRADLNSFLNNCGWVYFGGSFYYISSASKTWQQSRDDCLQKGADLVIVSSKEEQNFLNHFKRRTWIGLTDSETEGAWKWVDGTPLTTSYWGSGEPNGEKSENCVEIKYHSKENSWNDLACSNSYAWICEKKFLP